MNGNIEVVGPLKVKGGLYNPRLISHVDHSRIKLNIACYMGFNIIVSGRDAGGVVRVVLGDMPIPADLPF